MVAFAKNFAPKKPVPDAKNRVWGIFLAPSETRPANRLPAQQPRREKRVTVTIIVSGQPFWPNKDPIREQGGLNLYAMVANNPVNAWDLFGLSSSEDVPCDSLNDIGNRIGRIVGFGLALAGQDGSANI